jgi:hypothetical protein
LVLFGRRDGSGALSQAFSRVALRGEPACLVLYGSNARRVIFGATNVMTGHHLFVSAIPEVSSNSCG